MIFSFLPMLSMFNETIKTVARITYSQQISELINGIGNSGISAESIIVIAMNFAVATVLFLATFKYKSLE